MVLHDLGCGYLIKTMKPLSGNMYICAYVQSFAYFQVHESPGIHPRFSGFVGEEESRFSDIYSAFTANGRSMWFKSYIFFNFSL